MLERDKYLRRWQALKNERQGWDSQWRDLSRYILPYNGRFISSERNRGGVKFNTIYDSTATRAADTLAAGMMAGMTSPARPWFRLATANPELNESHAVKLWLTDVTRMLLDMFQRTNTYNALHTMYLELGVFGTAASFVMPDYNQVVRHQPLTCGEYAISTNFRGEVVALYREFDLTVDQMVGEFGYDKCSATVRNLYDSHDVDKWFTVIHVVERNEKGGRPWVSLYFEYANAEKEFLSVSGFDDFPAVCPRWQTQGGDIYGVSPGMRALGDIKQLQHEQLRKAEVIDFQTKPPIQVPSALKNREIDMMPGGVTYVDAAGQGATVKTMWEVRADLQHLLFDIKDVRERIKASFFADMFLMLANNSNPKMTATEVAERHEEKLLMLGPVLERLQNELLDPLVELSFNRMLSSGLLPPPPEELQGVDLNVEFVSMLAQAQRAVGVNSSDRFISTLGSIAQLKPEVLDKFDADKWADLYADQLGVDPNIIVPSEQVALIREQRAQAQQQAQQQEAMQQAVGTAKGASEIDAQGIQDVMGMFSGYSQ